MLRVNNNTDQSTERLLVLYQPEIRTVNRSLIECITFDSCRMIIFGVDCILLEVDERTSEHRAEDEAREYTSEVFHE